MRNRTWMLILAGLVAIAAAAWVLFPRGQTTADAGDPVLVAEGKTLYGDRCASCHGLKLQGEPNWRRRNADGSFPAPPHDETGHTWHHADALLFDYTKRGGQAVVGDAKFKSNMPGFGAELSDHEIWAVLAYIKSTWPERIQRRQAGLNKRQN